MAVFTLDRAGAADVLKMIASEEVAALAAEVAAAAGPQASVETKASKTRFVAIVKVPADLQATDGVLSKAVAKVGLRLNQYSKSDKKSAKRLGFFSQVQWRWAFWSKQPWALGKARETPGEKVIRYRQLPERSGTTAGKAGTPAPRKRGRPRKPK